MDDAMFPDPQAAGAPSAAYRVLARKYRPSGFADLIGQEPMVRTLENAFELNRIHQAYLLTGVRGVGKTTTARILARAFNYELPAQDGRAAVDRPTIHMDALGAHCQAIIDSRHPDVLEMDAASHTGIDDIREIIENARYRPVMARVKVYIIDEVHMLSKAAFNGLLKTLEEPPEHVKFIFATTEIDKVPVTVRSRCQRFDLRRIDAGLLAAHLRKICDLEAVTIEDEALAMVARAAEGSARDALSLLDQAIAHGAAGGGAIAAQDLRLMLGVADKSRVIDLFEAAMKGEIAAAIALLQDQYDGGADPAQVLLELAEFTHLVTRLKLAPDAAQSNALTEEERRRGGDAAGTLSISVLTRAWQILMKGVDELRSSPRPLASADMVLVRLTHAAEMPSPEEALRKLGFGQGGAPRPAPGSVPAAAPGERPPVAFAPAPKPAAFSPAPSALATSAAPAQRRAAEPSPSAGVKIADFRALVALAGEKRDIQLKIALETEVRLVRFEQGRIEFELAPGGSTRLPQLLMQKLQDWTGTRWLVALAAGGAPTLREEAVARESEKRSGIEADPLVASILARFPGAEIVAVRGKETEPAATAGAELAYDDEEPDDV
ncbi:DNA polymerase III subunit gamma/tau [Methylosinus sp. LW3]|uniref:DNA polymerase III subunit gamma/tau n=1 Tax=Methylosinus sp. LW3 TaxID=107635 RepID=UPI0004676336|nr:DNA polymerase III subunit gamma/tau [Methylosinus sp. LW3]